MRQMAVPYRSRMEIAVIIPAAGSSRRYQEGQSFGTERSKLDEDLGGRPVLHRTVELFTKHDLVSHVIVAGPADGAAFAQFTSRHADKLGLFGVKMCKGGATHRYESVRNALALVPDSATHIAVHDAARPCVSVELIDRLFEAAAAGHNAVVPGVSVSDTLKRVGEEVAAKADDAVAAILGTDTSACARAHVVVETVDRAGIMAIQTPQVFEAGLFRRAYAQKNLDSTDDAQLVERLGETAGARAHVVVVQGEASNIKITRAADLAIARAILGLRPPVERDVMKRF